MIAGRHQSGLWQLVPAAALVGHPMLFAISAARVRTFGPQATTVRNSLMV